MLKNTERNLNIARVLHPYLSGDQSEKRAAEVLGCSIHKIRKMVSGAPCEVSRTGVDDLYLLVAADLIPAGAINDIFAGSGVGGMHSLDGWVENPLKVLREIHPPCGDMAEVVMDDIFTGAEKHAIEPKIRNAHAALGGFLRFIEKTKHVCTHIGRRRRAA